MADPNVTPNLITSPIFLVRGLSNRIYSDKNLSPEHCEILKNVNRTVRGTMRRRNGNALYNATQITESAVGKGVTGLHQATFKSGSTLNFETAGTKVYTDDGTTRSDITGALTLTDEAENRTRFAFVQNQVVATNGVDETWTHNGSGNASALSGVPWTTCKDLVLHNNVLVALNTTEGGTVYPTRLRWCDINTRTFVVDITNWPADSIYEVYDQGAAIVGAVDGWGRLLVFKADGLYPGQIQTISGFIEYTMDKNQARRGVEFIARSSIIQRPEFAWAVARDGAYIIVPDGEGFALTNVTDVNLRSFWRNLNQARLQYAVSWFRAKDHQVRTLLSSGTNTSGHDVVLIYDWQSGDAWVDEPAAEELNFGASFIDQNVEYDFLGTDDGYVVQGDSGTLDNATEYRHETKFSPNDLELPGRDKNVINLITHYRDVAGSQTIELQVDLNQGDEVRATNLSLGSSLKYNTGLLYNTGLKYPGGTNKTHTYFVNRTAQLIAPHYRATDDFELIGYQVQYTIEE